MSLTAVSLPVGQGHHNASHLFGNFAEVQLFLQINEPTAPHGSPAGESAVGSVDKPRAIGRRRIAISKSLDSDDTVP